MDSRIRARMCIFMCPESNISIFFSHLSEPQYKKRLRLWRLEKNIPKRKILHLLRKMDQRLAEGKETECIFNGQVVSAEKLERSRHRFREELAREPASPAPCKSSPARPPDPVQAGGIPGILLIN